MVTDDATNLVSLPSSSANDETIRFLPSFPALRERNLRALYGHSSPFSGYGDGDGDERILRVDKSPKGSVDDKIRPLVDLINRHPEYVTLSSCSGRVALFDPVGGGGGGGGGNGEVVGVDRDDGDDDGDDDDEGAAAGLSEGRRVGRGTTEASGKGRGRWIFVTHDVLPDLGTRMIDSLREAGRERERRSRRARRILLRARGRRRTDKAGDFDDLGDDDFDDFDSDDGLPPIVFKHEPPLLHVAASSLAAGRRLLHIGKSLCAMRESGMVVTDGRVTVELRTGGTSLCAPLFVRTAAAVEVAPYSAAPAPVHAAAASTSSSPAKGEGERSSVVDVELVPSEEYLTRLAGQANGRMARNGALLDRLFDAVRNGLFEDGGDQTMASTSAATATIDGNDKGAEGGGDDDYEATLLPLPSLNLWKTAAVAVPRNVGEGKDHRNRESYDVDLDLLAFGGQGIGPDLRANAAPDGAGGRRRAPTTTCRRHDGAFRLARRVGVWSDRWDSIPIVVATSTVNDGSSSDYNDDAAGRGDGGGDLSDRATAAGETELFATKAGTFRVLRPADDGLGRREGHGACVLPNLVARTSGAASFPSEPNWSRVAVVIFGGRTGGPMSPSGDLFLFTLERDRNGEDVGIVVRPADVRGATPGPRFGHTMTALRQPRHSARMGPRHYRDGGGEPLAVVAGGTGAPTATSSGEYTTTAVVALSSVHVLSRVVDDDDSGLSHLVWDRVSDMPGPRSYHAAYAAGRSSDGLFIFGGMAEADNPFGPFDGAARREDEEASSRASWFRVPLSENEPTTKRTEKSVISAGELSSLIGSAAANLGPNSLKSDVVLIVGGTQSPASSDLDHHAAPGPLRILNLKSDTKKSVYALEQAKILSIQLAHSGDENLSNIIDFGSCVHHCLVALPPEKGAALAEAGSSVIIVGGGVPSFSFGQSYARSYLINIKQVKRSKHPKPQLTSTREQPKGPTPAKPKITPAREVNGKSMVEVEVIYVATRHAKEVKNELEALRLLDKRYKMVKVMRESLDAARADGGAIADGGCAGNVVIAIPVTKQFIQRVGATAEDASSDLMLTSFKRLMVGSGTEMVPYSSSAIGRMKQRQGLH